MILLFKKYSENSLQNKIRRKISLRIFILFILLIVFLLAQTAKNFYVSFDKIKTEIINQCSELEKIAIGQTLVNNPIAVTLSINNFNNTNHDMHIIWFKDATSNATSKIIWDFPFSWHYNYPLKKINNMTFGYFHVTGSFLSQNFLIRELLKNLIFVSVFIAFIFLLLFPLIKTIPNELFLSKRCLNRIYC